MKNVKLTAILLILSLSVIAQNPINIDPSTAVDESFFEFIPTVDYGNLLQQSGTTSFTTQYSASGSYWLDPTAADEQHVYLAKLQHDAATTENSWELRIGQGGQIYSFKSAYGEGIPPQSKEISTWVDEVWQPVAVSGSLNNRDFTSAFYFIHGAGAYNNDGIQESWYSPLMASYYNDTEKAYYVSNWGTQAHIPSLYKSETLYTTKYKEIGEGVLEVTYIIQNFGDETLSHINAPWGGVRASSLRGKFVGLPDGSIEISNGQTGTTQGTDTRDIDETGGYVIWSQDTISNTAPSMGMVFGNNIKTTELSSHGLRNVFMRLAQVGGDPNPRDYTLFTIISQINIERGETFYYRTYYINGTRDFVQTKANLLAPYSDYGFIEPVPETTPTVSVTVADSNQGLSQDISLFTSFTEDMLPIFLMKDTTTGEEYISPDLYYNVTTEALVNPYTTADSEYATYQNRFTYKPYESDIEYVRLLGYAYNKDMSADDSYLLLDNLILDNTKVVLTSNYTNQIWVQSNQNLALNGTARQSSTLHDGVAPRAIDDNTNGAYSGGSVTHTASETNAYWQVTLDDTYNIGDINIFGRTDSCCLTRLSNFTVLVYDESTRNFAKVVNSYPDPSVTVNANGATGNIIRIRSNTGASLSLAEVQVFESSSSSAKVAFTKDTEEDTVSIEESPILLFPNPTKNAFSIGTKNIKNITIYNISGKIVKSYNKPQNQYSIQDLISGFYYVKIDEVGKSTIKKLIKL
ncbi:T9SS type A sorting domain-containing protein [Flavivirga aquimarina]|uniref:T9SS type A sorting domain-containing protein n=1 Tax=Flavivirga aquimarina TaxID=2027862 RepID=A0ABT8W8Z2_9FLAO|nr:T9SS type A sorting domain-containing protein [Flavivirga aquimarina]MDO5969599.1 T9SS type A sorting domain-containing protein [Flavivirga aquimarina]